MKDGGADPSTPRKPSAGNVKTPKSGKATGSKGKQAESFNAANEDDAEPTVPSVKREFTVSVDEKGSPKKVKTEQRWSNAPICKTETMTADGAVDLVDDA